METKEAKTLGERVEELEEALDCTNSAMEELLFHYILKAEDNTDGNE